MAVQASAGLVGIHTNLPGVVPSDVFKAIQTGSPLPSGLSGDEMRAVQQLANTYKQNGYLNIMGRRPQTLTGLVDSPVGLASFMLDHDARSLQLISRAFSGHPGGLTRDDVLDNVTLTGLTDTAVSAALLYWENKVSPFTVKGISLPVAVSVFPDELYQAPRSWAEQAYPHLIHYRKLDKGGHFAAWEQPHLFAEELRAGFRSLRQSAAFERR
ncbi:hypothetical protein [Streptomyces chiangmaiensis]